MGLSAVFLRMNEWARRNGLRAIWVAVLVGLLAGAVLSVAGGARRTASAPDRYTASVGGDPDLLIQQQYGAPLTDAVRAIPGVAEARGAAFVAAWPNISNFADALLANPFAGDPQALANLIVDGRYADQSAPDEFTVNRPMATVMGAKIGDRFDIAAFDSTQTADPAFDGTGVPAIPPFQATLVGITESASEFEDPSPLIVYSGAMLTAHPDIGVVASFILVDTTPGTDPAQVLAAAQKLPGGDTLTRSTDSQYVSAHIRRAVHFVTVSLWTVAGITALGAALVITLLISQLVGPKGADRLTLQALGWRRQEFVVESLLESAAVASGAFCVAAAVVVATSGRFPFGAARVLEPNPGATVDLVVLGLGALAIFGVCTLAVGINELVSNRKRARVARSMLGGSASQPFWSLPVVVGIRFALEPPPRRRSAWTSLAPGVIGCAGLVAAMTVGLSLTQVIDVPARWGYNADAIYGNQWLPQTGDFVTPATTDPDVAELTAATLGTVTIDGAEVEVLAFESVKGSLDPEVLEGRVPTTADEIGLGREVARRLGKNIGDSVAATGPAGDQVALTVVGIVMTPYAAGGGAAMTYDGYAKLVPDSTKNILLVRFTDTAGPDAATALASLANSTTANFVPRPTSITSLDRVRPMPFLLAGILALLGAIALVQALAASVRDRRRDFGVLRALGAVGGQLRGLLHWQATTVAAVVLALGVPIGLLGGRVVFAAIADRVGVAPEPRIAWVLIPVLVATVVAMTNVAALMPGIRASRAPTLDLVAES